MKTELKNHICNRFYGISCEDFALMERVLKNADISILSNFLAIFANFFSISRNFTKNYLHAKFQINWTIRTEITLGGGGRSPSPPAIPICILQPGLFRVKGNSKSSRPVKYCVQNIVNEQEKVNKLCSPKPKDSQPFRHPIKSSVKLTVSMLMQLDE